MKLIDYPTGTRVRIGDRLFVRLSMSSFWREEHQVPGNCVSRPSSSLESIERLSRTKHRVVKPATTH